MATEGSIREKRPGYWQVRAYVGIDVVTGKRRYVSRSVAGDRADAERVQRRLLVDIDEGNVDAAAIKGTVGELLDRYLVRCETVGRSPTTIDSYRGRYNMIKRSVGSVPLALFGGAEIDAMYARMLAGGTTPTEIVHRHRALSAALGQAVKWGWLPDNPIKRATASHVPAKRVTPPTKAALGSLLAVAADSRNPDLAVAYHLAAATGARRGELCGLRWSDLRQIDGAWWLVVERAVIRLHGGRLIVKETKAGDHRLVSLAPSTVAVLEGFRAVQSARAMSAARAELAPEAFMLARYGDDVTGAAPTNPHSLSQALARLRTKAGYTGKLHDLRHWQASVLLAAGLSSTEVAARLGNSKEIVDKTYGHLLPDAIDRAGSIVEGAMVEALTPPPSPTATKAGKVRHLRAV